MVDHGMRVCVCEQLRCQMMDDNMLRPTGNPLSMCISVIPLREGGLRGSRRGRRSRRTLKVCWLSVCLKSLVHKEVGLPDGADRSLEKKLRRKLIKLRREKKVFQLFRGC
jgi:hypothetical protein